MHTQYSDECGIVYNANNISSVVGVIRVCGIKFLCRQ